MPKGQAWRCFWRSFVKVYNLNFNYMNDPLVSFCFTTFKRPVYLKSTLESVLAQTYQHFEVVVSDNDPEGSGKEVVESFQDARFQVLHKC